MLTLLYSGNFGLGHDLDTILRAVSILNVDINLRVMLVGDGKGLKDIQRLASELKLDNVFFHPPVKLNELPTLLASGDIHIVAQKQNTEGLIVPSKVYGTLAVGRPVLFLGPEQCEVAHIVQDSGCGFVVAPGDVKAAVEALRKLVLDINLRYEMGERAKRYYAEHFGRKRSVALIIDVIERVGENGRKKGQAVVTVRE